MREMTDRVNAPVLPMESALMSLFQFSDVDDVDMAEGFSVEIPDTYRWSNVVDRSVLVTDAADAS